MLHNPVTKWMKSNILLNVLRHAGFKHTCEEMILYLALKYMTGSKLKVLSIYESPPTAQECISLSEFILFCKITVNYSVKRLERHQTEIYE